MAQASRTFSSLTAASCTGSAGCAVVPSHHYAADRSQPRGKTSGQPLLPIHGIEAQHHPNIT